MYFKVSLFVIFFFKIFILSYVHIVSHFDSGSLFSNQNVIKAVLLSMMSLSVVISCGSAAGVVVCELYLL